MKPNIFNYIDSRQYLLDIIVYSNKESPGFSFREVARCLGSRSKSFLQKVIDRKIELNQASVRALSKYFHLKNKERDYFLNMVAFETAGKQKEKDQLLQKMREQRQYPSIKQINEDQYNYFSTWYMPVVRELVSSKDYDDDPQWIADRIVPKVSVEEVRSALTLLASLQMIARDEKNGKWKMTDHVISSTPEVLSTAAIQYHTDVINLGCQAISRFEQPKRDIRSVTFKVSEAGYKAMKKRVEAFWREVMAASDTQANPDRVYTFNMQLFPVSTPEKEPNPS